MREFRTSGSVGAPGERSPGATRQCMPCLRFVQNAQPSPQALGVLLSITDFVGDNNHETETCPEATPQFCNRFGFGRDRLLSKFRRSLRCDLPR
jgi:hypothetical protein